MSFPARFTGACNACDTYIRVGDEIETDGTGVVHVVCPAEDVRAAGKVCSVCFTELPVTGVCGVCE